MWHHLKYIELLPHESANAAEGREIDESGFLPASTVTDKSTPSYSECSVHQAHFLKTQAYIPTATEY